MMRQWRVTFDVDGDCSDVFPASSADEARAAAIEWFRHQRFWADRYPVTPPCTVQEISQSNEPGGSHGDIGPFR
jgi:hypothetical protein